MIVETILLVGLVLAFLLWLTGTDSRVKAFGDKIPGPPGYPIIGNAFTIGFTGTKCMKKHEELGRKYKGAYRLYMGNILTVVVNTPEDIEAVFSSTEIITKSFQYNFLNSWLGTGLLTSTGQKWHSRRKIITPTFHFKILDEFLGVFNRNANSMVDSLAEKANGVDFNVMPIIKKCALGSICETAMGSEYESNGSENANYIEAVEKICHVLVNRMNRPWLYSDFLYKVFGGYSEEKELLTTLKRFTDKVVKDKKAELSFGKEEEQDEFGIKKRTGFLEQLLKIRAESNASLSTDDDIVEEVNTFMFAGHDTSSSTICWTLNILAKNPDVQEKLYQELHNGTQAKDFARDDLNEMKYLERVIKEALRYYPTIPFVGRSVTQDFKLPSGYVIPKGAMIVVNMAYNHKNPEQFKNPEKFNPDNFLPEEIAKRHAYSFTPFSAGPRNCIGQKFAMMEVKTVLAKIILNFKVEPATGEEPVPDPRMVLHSTNGFNIKMLKR